MKFGRDRMKRVGRTRKKKKSGQKEHSPAGDQR